MSATSRRDFVKKAALTTGLGAAAPVIRTAAGATASPNEQVNVAVVGIHGRGRSHYSQLAKIPNVRVVALCDVDERLFPACLDEVEQIAGYRPDTVVDYRKLIERKDIDAVSIATPDYWHALMTVWGCQAGKDVYVEKPVSYTVVEGRRMVQAARKYNRIVQAGLQMRSAPRARATMRFLHSGEFGSVYRAKAIIYKGRASIGSVDDMAVPKGVHWDLYRGPAPMRPFNLNRFHYGWHFFWDTATADIGNTGVHHIDASRWGMNKHVHPVKVHCGGGVYVWDSDQETPNVQTAMVEYADGTIMEIELTNLYTPPYGGIRGTGQFFFTDKGYISPAEDWKTVAGKFIPRKPDIRPSGVSDHAANVSFPKRIYEPGPAIPDLDEPHRTHFENFIDCVRSRKREDLHCEILEGHMSTTIAHLANISYRTGRKLVFDPETEQFVGDEEANSYLTREYRKPYVMPDKV